MNDDRLARLDRILARALHRAELTRAARRRVVQKVAPDPEAKRAMLRRLLAEDFDGMRFRWYFTNVKKDTQLEELRAWIDSKIAEDK